MSKSTVQLVCGTLLVLVLIQSISGHKIYSVGDDQGWSPNVDYKAWSAGKTFYIGDVLEFKYAEGLEVQEVIAKDFEACNSNAIALFESHSGKTAIPLKYTGSHYFICGMYDYCKLGMKLNITVHQRYLSRSELRRD